MFRFKWNYFLAFIMLFITEALIAAYMHDRFIRPWFGDFLVVILLYCFVRSISTITVWSAALSVLLLSYIIELSQYYHLALLLGLEGSTPARLLIGSTFEWTDILAYTMGIITILSIETSKQANTEKTL